MIHVYRLDITYPEGSHEPGWEPAGWTTPSWSTYSTFAWPREHLYLSVSGANSRARLLESYGATVSVVQSLPVMWP